MRTARYTTQRERETNRNSDRGESYGRKTLGLYMTHACRSSHVTRGALGEVSVVINQVEV